MMMSRVNERRNWPRRRVEEENKQAKLIGRIMIEDQGAIFLYEKHETSINPPNYVVGYDDVTRYILTKDRFITKTFYPKNKYLIYFECLGTYHNL